MEIRSMKPQSTDGNAEQVLNKVGRQLTNESERSLWESIRSELRTGGTLRAESHIKALIKARAQRVKDALEQVSKLRPL